MRHRKGSKQAPNDPTHNRKKSSSHIDKESGSGSAKNNVENSSKQLDWWENESVLKSTSIVFGVEDSSSESLDLGNSEESDIQPKRNQKEKKKSSARSKLKDYSSDELDLGESYSDSASYEDDKKEKQNNKKAEKEKRVIEKQKELKKVPARRMSISDEEGLNEYQPNGDPLINLDVKSPLIWTFGVPVMILIIFLMEILQQGGIAPFGKNLFIGATEEVSVLFGAKQYDKIISGDFWRFLTAIFVEMNAVHYILSILLLFSCREVEEESGFWRAFIVFVLSGVYGYILSALCVPWVVSGGFSGAAFGYVGLVICDIISTWRMDSGSKRNKLTCISIVGVIILVLGFTPYIDNFPHYGGFIMGFFAAMMLLPNMSFDEWERKCHGITSFLAFPILSVIFMLTTVFVYRGTTSGNYICMWCRHLTCININSWCPEVENGSSVVKYYE